MRFTTWGRTVKAVALSAVGALLLTGCDFSVYEMPLPGGPDVGDDPLVVTVVFDDVLDLVPQSSVKVNDITVGQVSDITLDGYDARVELELKNGVSLPANTVAELRQTSLLGEKFVSLESPESPSEEPLEDGDVIPLDRSGRNPEVEEVLGALSLLLNGGGVAQLKTINRELGDVLEGREGAARSVLRQIEQFMGQLDAGKEDIVEAIESLNRLALSVEEQLPTIDAALEELPSALDSINRQRDDIVRMLRAINELSDVAVEVIRASKASTIESFEQLVPVLTQLANSGDAFTKAFHVFLTYPFVDEVVGRDPQVARNLHMGDYTNLSVQLAVDLRGENGSVEVPELPELPDVPVEEVCTTLQDVRDQLGQNVPLDELLAYLEGLDDLCDGARRAVNRCLGKDGLGKIARCLENTLDVTIPRLAQGVVDNTCDILGIPPQQCPDLGDGGGGGGGGGGGPLPDLPGLPELPGLGRPAFGSGDPSDPRGPTYGQLAEAFDPALVKLLVPGMVLK